MPIIDLQRRMREVGRIRTGQQVTTNGKRRPAKLEHFRLTSPSHDLIDAAARIWGGHPRAWEGQWELITESDSLDIVIPPGQNISQWNELWSGGGCQRRCDGRTNVITDEPCACPADPAERRELASVGQACKPTTRLNVMLPDLPDIGVWRLESHGYYAASELAGTVDVLVAAGRLIPARLRLEQREVKRPGKPVNRFAVPVIELPSVRIGDLMDGTIRQQIPAAVNRRERVPRPELPAGPPLPSGQNGHAKDVEASESSVGAVEDAGSSPAPTTAKDICAVTPEKDNALGLTLPCSRMPGHKGPHAQTEGSWPQ